jgi:glutaredoxin
MTPSVILYGRAGCCLCDEAREVLLRAQERLGFAFAERDIEDDDALLHSYFERIPVVTIDGTEVFEFVVDEARLEQALAGAGLAERHQ